MITNDVFSINNLFFCPKCLGLFNGENGTECSKCTKKEAIAFAQENGGSELVELVELTLPPEKPIEFPLASGTTFTSEFFSMPPEIVGT